MELIYRQIRSIRYKNIFLLALLCLEYRKACFFLVCGWDMGEWLSPKAWGKREEGDHSLPILNRKLPGVLITWSHETSKSMPSKTGYFSLELKIKRRLRNEYSEGFLLKPIVLDQLVALWTCVSCNRHRDGLAGQ